MKVIPVTDMSAIFNMKQEVITDCVLAEYIAEERHLQYYSNNMRVI